MGTCQSVSNNVEGELYNKDIENKSSSKEAKASVEHPIALHTDMIYDIIVTGNSNETISCGVDKTIVRYDWKNKTIQNKWAHHSKSVDKLVYGERSKHLFSGSRDTTIRQWNLNSKAEVQSYRGHTLPVSGLVINTENSQLCSGSRDYSVRFWDIETNQQIKMLVEKRNVVTCMSWIPGEESILQGSEDLFLRIWDARSYSIGQKFDSGTSFPLACDVSCDSLYFVTAHNGVDSDGCEVKLWDRRKNSLLETLKGHTQAVYDCLFLPPNVQGKTLIATSSKDQSIKIWEQETNSCLSTTTIKKGSSEIRCLAAASQSRNPITLYSGSGDGFITCWNVKSNGKLDCIAQSKRPAGLS